MVADAAVAVDAVADVAAEAVSATDAVVVVAAAAVLAPPARAPFRTLLERSKRSMILIEVHHTTHKNERYTMTTKKKMFCSKSSIIRPTLCYTHIHHQQHTHTPPLAGFLNDLCQLLYFADCFSNDQIPTPLPTKKE